MMPGFGGHHDDDGGGGGVAMSLLLRKDKAGSPAAEDGGNAWLDGSRSRLGFGEASLVREPQLAVLLT